MKKEFKLLYFTYNFMFHIVLSYHVTHYFLFTNYFVFLQCIFRFKAALK